ncbi:MAG: hypothetical protein ABIN80_25325 [Dyadobacter sp.]|uniref:hypothetical protein n=1 Tax=Dyadobacter sp. TaxID=1914288 RepID=UPI003265F45F
MKYLYSIILFCAITSCESELPSQPKFILPSEILKMPGNMLAFAVDEVPKENIRFINLDKSSPNYNHIVVTLPKTYTKGDKIIARIKLSDGYGLRNHLLREYEAREVELDFSNTNDIPLLIYDKKNDFNVSSFHIYVDPTVPLTATSAGKDYEQVLEGQGVYFHLPVDHLGTAQTITETDSAIHQVSVLIKNKKTNLTTIVSADYSQPNESNELFVHVPPEIEAGEYELTIQKQDRKVVVPDALILKYGSPIVQFWPVTSTIKDDAKTISFNGYNLIPNHEYLLELKSDFSETQRLKLSPANHLSIQYNFPASFPAGNYEAALFIDGKELPSYMSFNRNVVIVKKESSQPMVTLLSNYDNGVPGEVLLYKAITTFKRNQVIIGDFRDGVRANMVLLFKNTTTGKQYELPYSGSTPNFMSFSYFNIPANVPNGKYEVRVREGDRVSERYQRVVTIE